MQKMNGHLFGKNLDVVPQKLNIFLIDPNDNLKNICHCKIILGHEVFQLLPESTFSVKLSLVLNSSS